MQVVDMNASSLVTLLLSTPSLPCPLTPSINSFSNLSSTSFKSQTHTMSSLLINSSGQTPTFCTDHYCLNGGRCVPTETASRCNCPGGTIGPRCKVISRRFLNGGWVWLPRLPSTLPLHISLQFMSQRDSGLIMYQGPFSVTHIFYEETSRPVFALFIDNGTAFLKFEYSGMNVNLSVNRNGSLSDDKWHSIHVSITKKSVSLMMDYCTGHNQEKIWGTTSCFASYKFDTFRKKIREISWGSQAPLQIGSRDLLRWRHQHQGFQGCISHLRIGKKLVDLGEPAFSSNTEKHCFLNTRQLCNDGVPFFVENQKESCLFSTICQEGECIESDQQCTNSSSISYLKRNSNNTIGNSSSTFAEPISSPVCEEYSRSVTLDINSYTSIALSFIPDPRKVSIQLKFKTISKEGLLVQLSSSKSSFVLSLYISKGHLCLRFSTISSTISLKPFLTKFGLSRTEIANVTESLEREKAKLTEHIPNNGINLPVSLCLTKKPVSDGAWHSVYASKMGHNFVLQLDDGDDWQYNETVSVFDPKITSTPPLDFWIDVRGGVSVGGVPKHAKKNVSHVYQDLINTCLAELKISGQRLPLPPIMNNTDSGQVTTVQGMKEGCDFKPKINCKNINCPAPFQCQDVQGQPVCGCKVGQVFTPSGCRNMDQCLFGPCLNGGTCRRSEEGYSCLCPAGVTGKYCEWNLHLEQSQGLSSIIAIAVGVSSFVFLITVIMAVIFVSRRRRLLEKDEHVQERETFELPNQPPEFSHDSCTSPAVQKQVASAYGCIYSQDDLRNYAYEGEGSSSESLGSLFTSLQNEIGEHLETMKMDPHLSEVMDLVDSLPDAVTIPHSSIVDGLKWGKVLNKPSTTSFQSSIDRQKPPSHYFPEDEPINVIGNLKISEDKTKISESTIPGKFVSV